MTQLILKQVRIIDPSSPFHQKTRDIFISEGKIKEIAASITQKGVEQIEGKGAMVSPGWLDMRANFRDPGFEYKEDLKSGAKAAAAGGFTAVALLPDTFPVLQSKSEIEYIRNTSSRLPIDALPMGAISKDLEGTEITEMFDMHQSGAVAFSNANCSIKAGVMQRALLYVRGFDGLLCVQSDEASISAHGQMHEGYQSTLLGLKGIPDHAETISLERDLALLRYTGGKIHFSHISTEGAVKLIRAAKKEGLRVSCDVAVHQLLYDDSHLEEYDSRYKVFPPFRTKNHIKALKNAVLDGTIDAVVSDHHPEDTEHKEVEFDYAAFGISSIQTVLPTLLAALPSLSDERLVEVLSHNPRKILNQELNPIAVGNAANLTVFNREGAWTLNKASNRSKSIYSPLWMKELKGKINGTYCKGKWNQA